MKSSVRVGQGWDIHPLVEGRPLKLGGLTIPHDRGLKGHSDGDAVLHAVADALLGAAAAGDIGSHFSDRDERNRGIDSASILERTVAIIGERGYEVGNVDVNILAERPRLSGFYPAMRERIAAILGVDVDQVSVKARTMEGFDAVGRGEAIAAMAVCLISARPDSKNPDRRT